MKRFRFSRAQSSPGRKLIVYFFILLFASACSVRSLSATPTPSITPTASPSIAASPTQPPTSTPAPTPAASATALSIDLPAPQYTLSADLDDSTHSLSVQEQIAYTNRSGQALNELLLVADALIYPGSLDLAELKSSSGPAVKQTSWEKTQLHVNLETPLLPGAAIQLELAYTLILPARSADPGLRPMVFGWSERQTNLVDWYLYIPPFQNVPGRETGWIAHAPGYYGEHQAYEASDFTVNLRILNAARPLTVAASAPETLAGDWRSYSLKNARTFALSFSPDYQVSSATVGDVSLQSYFYNYHASAGQAALKTAADSLALYGRLFGAYPHTSLAVVEADFLDGMEYDGLFFLSNGFYNLYHGTSGEYLIALSAHETAHQWWYGLVGSDQALEPWLDEALSTYCERLYFENLAPDALDWWWQVRVQFYNPRGFVDDSIYNPHHEAQAYRAYRDAVYLNGALFLEDLRHQVGDDAFFAFLKDYATLFRGKLANSSDFFAVLREHTSADLSGLIKKYFASQP